MSLFLFVLGLVALIAGAKFLVTGAARLARIWGLSPLIVGLTIVAFGTSAPEIAVCSFAAYKNLGSLVVGNVVGSNIFNTLFILGITAMICPIEIKRRLIRLDVPLLILASALFWLFCSFGTLYRWQGVLLLLGICSYTIYAIFSLKEQEHAPRAVGSWPLQILWIVLGAVLLAFGSRWLVLGATQIARYLGVSELMIGLTIVAISTSLPELVTSLVALSKKQGEMAIGNIIGSNLFNLLAVGGIAALVRPISIAPDANFFDIPVMLASAIALLPIFLSGHRISRSEGVLLLLYYVVYFCYLTFAMPPLFTIAFFGFLLPLTVIGVGISVIRHFRKS